MTLCFECPAGEKREASCCMQDTRTFVDHDGDEQQIDFNAYLCRGCFDRLFPENPAEPKEAETLKESSFVDGGKKPPTNNEKPSGGLFAGW